HSADLAPHPPPTRRSSDLWLVHQKAEAGVGDPDIWWHLENARLLVTTHHLPRFDTFSYTTLGHPWMDHEWLSEVAYYLAWRALRSEEHTSELQSRVDLVCR